jgi:large subunit ribosomal protein L3
VIAAGPCTVLQKKTVEKEKYAAYQLGFGDHKEKNTSNGLKGHFKMAQATPKSFIREFRTESGEDHKVGDVLTVSRFTPGQLVDIIAISKGKGNQGVVRRWRFAGGGAAHGSKSHRRPGAIGMRAWPGRIWKNARMGGHMGDKQITIQNLPVVQIRESENLLMIRGSVAGSNGGYLYIRSAIKGQPKKKKKA